MTKISDMPIVQKTVVDKKKMQPESVTTKA